MYIQRNKVKSKSGKEYSSVLLCTKYREGSKIKTRVEANLSKLPEHVIVGIENMLKSERETPVQLKDISISRCIDYGYIYVLMQKLRELRIDEVLEKTLYPADAALVKAMIVGKIVTGGSKLCIYNWLCRERAICEFLGVNMQGCKVDALYRSLGQMSRRQGEIEKKWMRYHKGAHRRIYLYDITSSYFEGTHNALAAYGYNRDGKRGKMQMCVGLLTGEDGFPLRIEAFAGNTSDSKTVSGQLHALKKEFGAERIIFVGDRGMQITYNLENEPELLDENIDFITGLTRTQIHALIAHGKIELGLFNSDLAEVTVDGLRYILSVNPALEVKEQIWLENACKRVDALVAHIRKSWEKRCARNRENHLKQQEKEKKYKHLKTELTVKDTDNYKRRVAHVLKECGMGKYYTIAAIDNERFEVEFKQDEYDKSYSLCGKYVVCTGVPAEEMSTQEVRGQYKNLQHVEHAFRDIKSDNINIRPIFHYNELQTRGHVLLCMFAYAIIKELENKLFPFLKEYNRNHSAQLSFNDLIAELNNIKICELNIGKGVNTLQYPELNPLQEKLVDVLCIDPKKMIDGKMKT